MPPIDQPVPKAKAKKPPKVRVTRPDAGDETRTRKPAQPTVKVRMYAHPERNTAQNTFRTARTEQVKAREHRAEVKRAVSKIHVTPVASPDARDSLRSPAQKARDTAAAQQSVQSSRVKALREQQAGSGTRAVVNYVKTNVADEKKVKTTDAHGHGAGKLALVEANLPVGGFSLKMLKNAGKDVAELAVTTPSSVGKLASDVVHHPKKVPGELVKPYLDLAKNPLKTAEEKPVSTALMLQPVGRVPGRVVGRVARATGKQTLERAPATLPHTALQEARIGSRDAALRSAQARRDAAAPAPTVTPKEVQRRVDEHYDHAKHESHRIVGEHVKAAKKATKGQPKDARTAAVEAAREQGRQVADAVAQERFAREFGANERLSHGHVQRDLLHRERRSAVARADTARAVAKVADKAHDAALTAARAARSKAQSSPALQALERQRHAAVQALTSEQKAAAQARLAHERAHANARVSAATPKTNVRIKALTAEQRAAARVKRVEVPKPERVPAARVAVPGAVKTARAAVGAADRRLNALRRAMQLAEEKASRLEGLSVGRAKGGKMTAGVSKQIADHADYMGALRDALTQAERDSTQARAHLKAAEGEHRAAQRSADRATQAARHASEVAHRGAVRAAGREASQSARTAARAVEQRIAAERARISGVAPKEHQALLDAIDRLAEAPGKVGTARARVKALDQQIADERQRISGVPPAEHQALTNAIHARGAAHAAFAQARAAAHAAAHEHIAAKKAMTNATLVSPAKEGRLFAHKADAATLVKKLNQATTDPEATFVLRQVGEDRWAAVPKVATQRLLKHQVVGTSPATMAKVMRVSRGAFTQATLPFSLKWLAGQGIEAPIRAAIAGAGPMDWLRVGKIVKKMNAQKAGSGDEWARRQTGGHFDLTGPARDFANGKSLADEFADTPLSKPANVTSAAAQAPGVRHVRLGFKLYSRAALGSINHLIESNTRRAMTGQAIKNLGFQDEHIIGLMDGAIEDAANRLHETHNQLAAARAVNKMYGKYQGFSPEMRTLIMHWSPFAPWFFNSVYFLAKTLPFDHPVKAALLADASNAEEEWRKAHGLSFRGPHVPWYLMGSYPTKDGKYLRVGHYTPWGIGADPTGAVGSLAIPQFEGPIINTLGVDWKGQPLTRGGPHGPEFNTGEKALRALVTAAEEQIPGVSQAGAISGLTPRYVNKDNPENIKSPGEVLKSYLPTTPASGGAASSSGTPSQGSSASARVKIPGVGSGRIKLPGGTTGRIKVP
jgi:hypothetical protein